MKKAITFWVWLVFQVSILFIVGMLMTFANDTLQRTGFFGDVRRLTPEVNTPDSWYDWGARHYWYFWMMFCLFLLSLVRIGIWAEWFWSVRNKKLYN